MAKQKRRNRQLQIRIYRGWKQDYWKFITPTEYMVYSCIADYADWTTGIACPTFNTICLDTGISKDTIRLATRWLEAIGVVTTEFKKARNTEGEEYGRKRFFYTLAHKPNERYTRNDNRVRPNKLKALLPKKHEIIGG